jgi:hypothetical protein
MVQAEPSPFRCNEIVPGTKAIGSESVTIELHGKSR